MCVVGIFIDASVKRQHWHEIEQKMFYYRILLNDLSLIGTWLEQFDKIVAEVFSLVT